MHQFSDEELMSYADGEADAVTEARIDEQLITDNELQERLSVFTQTTELLAPYNAILKQSIPDSIQTPLTTLASITPNKKKHQYLPLALAASVALCVGLGFGFVTGKLSNNPQDNVLHAALPSVLDQQASGMPVLVEVNHTAYEILPLGTYKNTQDQYCRRFELTHLPAYTRTGLACQADNGAWAIQLLLPTGVMQALKDSNGEYATASSGSGLVKATLATMGFDQIVSTEEESDLIQQQWRE